MDAHEIEKYLSELGAELAKRGVKKPVPIMIIGGAYMLLLEKAPRTTNDVDVFWLEEEAFQRAREPLSECVLAVTRKYALSPDWFNYLTQFLMQNDIFVPDGELWKQFGPLHIYVPPKEYILALKITAGRDKDLDDCAILFPQSGIVTYEQAKQLLDRYILPETQKKHAEQIERSLNRLFKDQ
jgi:hypothetical protein